MTSGLSLAPEPGRRWRLIKRYKVIYAMLFPAVILVFVFSYVPLFGWILAFKNYTPATTIWNAPWAGLNHFRQFFSLTGDYLYTIRNTLVMNLGTIFLNLSAAFVFAILLNEFRFPILRKTVSTTTVFPHFISWTITYALIYAFFAPNSGVINQLRMAMGKRSINVLGLPQYSWALILLANMWKYVGYNTVLFSAAISSIEQEQFEAAEIDGASRFQKIYYILVPHLLPTLCVMLILNSGSVFNSDIGMYSLFTNATNWSTMEVMDMYVYKFGIQKGNYSYATAVGIIKSFISIGMVFLTNGISKKLTERSIF